MASTLPPPNLVTDDKKRESVTFLEREQTNATADSEMAKPVPQVGKTDYSGAHEKTDPKEIALVKKLDRWMMPMLWSMCMSHPYCFFSLAEEPAHPREMKNDETDKILLSQIGSTTLIAMPLL
jgi:hypothetical protein